MFVRIVLGIFMVLHGLVHLLYFGHGLRFFELPDLAWPDGSWVFRGCSDRTQLGGWQPGRVCWRRLGSWLAALGSWGAGRGGSR